MAKNQDSVPVAIYLRLSLDDGQSTALERQEKECRELAEGEGWTVVRVYRDSDASAFSGKDRRAFAEMLADVRTGAYAGVLAWKLDRFMRGLRSLVDLSEACDASGTFYRTKADNIDSRVAGSQFMAAITTVAANEESKSLSLRQKARQRERREHGKPPGGGKRPFGHTYF